jgi:nuclear RNA export factor
MRRFPTLEILDQEPLAKIAFDVPEASTSAAPPVGPRPPSKTFPAQMQTSFVTGVDNVLITGFLGRFVPLRSY